ncbi:hypothetical protein [Specibacter cremeus]|uniref:hypothetical protein n=1 Tax=Specibacter cremeus TaxID=1629051 RepID=UPI000F7709FB|nr:hypothetical protein [Specibacter cremeus]
MLECTLGLVLRMAFLSAVVLVAVSGPSGLDVDAGHTAAGVLFFAGLALLSGTAALLGGVMAGRRVWGIGVGAAVAVLARRDVGV